MPIELRVYEAELTHTREVCVNSHKLIFAEWNAPRSVLAQKTRLILRRRGRRAVLVRASIAAKDTSIGIAVDFSAMKECRVCNVASTINHCVVRSTKGPS